MNTTSEINATSKIQVKRNRISYENLPESSWLQMTEGLSPVSLGVKGSISWYNHQSGSHLAKPDAPFSLGSALFLLRLLKILRQNLPDSLDLTCSHVHIQGRQVSFSGISESYPCQSHLPLPTPGSCLHLCYCLDAKSYRTLCNSMDCSLPGSSVHWILQARILERVAISSSRGLSWPRNWTQVSCIAGQFFTTEPPGNAFRSWIRHSTKVTQSVSGGPGIFPQGKEATVTRKGSNAFFWGKLKKKKNRCSVFTKKGKKAFFPSWRIWDMNQEAI